MNSNVIKTYLACYDDIAQHVQHLKGRLEDINLELIDLDHHIELSTLTQEQKLALFNTREQLLLERRKCKDELRILDHIVPKQVEGLTTRDRYAKVLSDLGKRKYTPRRLSLTQAVEEGMAC